MSETSAASLAMRTLARKVTRKWWLFLIVPVVSMGVAVAYIKTTAKQYQVTGVMLMSNTKRNNFGASGEEFIKGVSYLNSSSGLEDEVSVLMSFTNMLNTVQQLDIGITYYEKKNFLEHEIYENKPFVVRLDTGLQVSGALIHVEPNMSAGTYRVWAKGKFVQMFNAGLQRPSDQFIRKLELDKTVKIGEPFHSPYLNFSITFDPGYTTLSGASYSFVPASNTDVASYYRDKTSATPKSDESNIVTIATAGGDTKKEMDFINTLMQTYIKGEQDKQNEKGKKTIAFIDDQLDR